MHFFETGCTFLTTVALRIGFPRSTYTFVEPREPRNVTISLEKQDGRRTEQTFLISVVASASSPNAKITPATISSVEADGSVNNNDYSISTPGDNTVLVIFRPEEQTVEFELTLYPDNVTEGLEGFRVERLRDFTGPPFLPPTSDALLSSIFILIDECKLKGKGAFMGLASVA